MFRHPLADELVDDPGMPWHYKTRTSARDVYDAMKPVHNNLHSMGVHVIPTCIPYMHMIVARFGECHVTSESNHAAYTNTMLGAG